MSFSEKKMNCTWRKISTKFLGQITYIQKVKPHVTTSCMLTISICEEKEIVTKKWTAETHYCP